MATIDGRVHCRFEFDGKAYEYHGEGGYQEYREVKTRAGLSVLHIVTALGTGDIDALLALVWLAKRAAGETVTWDEVMEQMTDPQALVSTVEPIDPPAEPKPAAKPKARKPVAAAVPDEPEPTPAT